MGEQTVSASEMRDKFADYLEKVEGRRFLISKYGQDAAYLIGVRELRALEETLEILDNSELMRSIERGIKDMKADRVRDADEVFTELDAEFVNDEG